MLKGIDFSHWQRFDPDPGTLKAAGVVFIAHKAGEIGASVPVDEQYHRRREKYQAEGFLWAAYYYEDGVDGISQADFFLDTVAPLDGNTALWLDLEKYANLQQAEQFLQRVHDRAGVWCACYTRAEYIVSEIHATKSQILKNCQVILADPDSAIAPLVPLPWSDNDWFIWQKSTFNISGVTVDLDYFNGTDIDKLRKAWKVASPVAGLVQAKLKAANVVPIFTNSGGPLWGWGNPGDPVSVLTGSEQTIDGVTYIDTPDDHRIRLDYVDGLTPTPPPTTTKQMVTLVALNLRDAPTTSGRVLTTMPQGATVTVTFPTGQDAYHWAAVSYGTLKGYAATTNPTTGTAFLSPH